MTTEEFTINQRLYSFKHKGTKIIWCDFSKSGPEQMIELLKKAASFGLNEVGEVNFLVNFKSTPKSPEFSRLIKEYGKQYKLERIDVKVAALGIDSQLKRVIANATIAITKVKGIKVVETKEQALDWLTQ